MTTASTTALAAPATRVPAITVDIFDAIMTLTFSDGRGLTLNANKLKENIRHDALMHGLKQKLVDAAAIGRNPNTGRSATIEDKYNAVHEVFDRISREYDPQWNKGRAAGDGESTGGNSLLLKALCRMSGKSPASMSALLDSKTKEEKAALRTNPKVATIIAEIQAERLANSEIDSDELLSSIM
jgi:hypothetical protein